MNLEKNKKAIMELILYTIVLIFLFLHIKTILHLLSYVIGLFMPFIIGCILAFVLNVLLNLVENKLFAPFNKKKNKVWEKCKRPVSLVTTFIMIIAVIALILGLVIPQLKNTTQIFTENFDSYKKESVEVLDKFGVSEKQINKFNNSIAKLQDNIADYVDENKEEVMHATIGIASSVFGTIATTILGIVFAIYILLKKEDLNQQAKQVLKAYSSPKKDKKITDITTLTYKTFGNFISGQFIEAIIIGILCFIGMLILRIPYASTISVLVGFTALIPVFGAFIGTGVGAFLIFMIDPGKALAFIIFILILQQVEGNLIYPKVVGKSVGLPGIWVMVAVTVGASISGIMGMLISVPLCSIIYSIFKTNVKDRIEQKEKVKSKGITKT